MKKCNGLFVLDPEALELAYGPEERERIAGLVDLVDAPQTRATLAARPDLLRGVDVILSGWGAPVLDEALLDACPRLKAVFYAAGSIASWMTEAAWDRGVVVSSALAANAIPVAEYAFATILFSLKHGWRLARETRNRRAFVDRNGAPGCYRTTVGLISLGATARALRQLLGACDVRVLAYDPFVSREEAAGLGVELVSLDELFARCDAVSLHAPLLDETIGMIEGRHLATMKRGATFINTARGQLVRQDEMIGVLTRRPDLQAVLDVADPEPLPADSPLYTLPNVVLTPHIAGSVGTECRRMGRWMVEELERYLSGQPMRWVVARDSVAWTSHRLRTRDTRTPHSTPLGARNGRHVVAVDRGPQVSAALLAK